MFLVPVLAGIPPKGVCGEMDSTQRAFASDALQRRIFAALC